MNSVDTIDLIITIILLTFFAVFAIPSCIHGLFPPYNPADTVLVDTAEFEYARAIGVVVDNSTGTISFPSYYNWEMSSLSYDYVRHDGNFVYKSGEAIIRPNNLDDCWSLMGCK